jgi:uncharacterized protein YjdB
MKSLILTFLSLFLYFATFATPGAIHGANNVCAGSNTTFSDDSLGGTWSSNNTSIATIGATSGILFGVRWGTAIITYTTLSGNTTKIIAVDTYPTAYTLTMPGGGSYCAGGPGVDITLNGSNIGDNYQLRLGGVVIATFAGTGSPLDFGNHTTAGTYTAVGFNGGGCATNMIGSLTLTINPLPNVYTVSGGGSYCSGGAGVRITLNGSDIGISYQLYLAGVPIGFPVPGTGTIIDFGSQTIAGIYTVVASNPSTLCVSNMAGSTTITVSPLPSPSLVTGGGSYCSGGSGVHVGLSYSYIGIVYQLLRGGVFFGLALPGTGVGLDFGAQTVAGIYTVMATNVVTGCQKTMIGSVVVGVYALPTAFTVTGGGSYCAGGAGLHVGVSGSVTGVNYELLLGGVTTGITVAGTGMVLDFGLQTAAGNYTVLAANIATGCTNPMTGSAVIVINPPITSYIIGTSSVCTGSTIALTDTTSGGTWTSDNTAIATVSSTGVVTGISAGTANITYLITGGCYTGSPSKAITVYTTPVITGAANVCSGLTSTLAGSITGTWGSSDTSIATIATIGGFSSVVTGITTGSCVITLTSAGGCYATAPLSVSPLPVITSSSSYGCGDTYTLTAGGGVTYSWVPTTGLSCPTCAITTVNPAATTAFTVTGTDALGCPNTSSVSVNGNRIKGFITFGGPTPDTLDMKVWLIQYDPTDSSITAMDSTITCAVDSIGYYEFDGKPAGNYLAKAKLLYGNTPGSTGYVPTYSLSTPNWYSAATVAHAGGSDTLHMNMIYGLVPSGPGFISGYVYSGAGREASAGIPVAGLQVLLKDNLGTLLTYTFTDATGAYSFSGLGFNDYMIYPEAYDFNTVASNVVSLNSSHPTVNAVDFKQYVDSRVIAPVTIVNLVPSIANTNGINLYPNPASGAINIQWTNQAQGVARIVITDVLGRAAYASTLNIGAANGQQQINIDGLKDGIYQLSIKSGNIYYSCKLVVQK